MTIDEIARRLRESYDKAGKGHKALSIHLFGIRYADVLADMPLNEVVIRAGVRETYQTELRKGINIAPHVVLKTALIDGG